MNQIDTPRTDYMVTKCQEPVNAETAFGAMNDHAEQLERELTAVTEQRDRLAVALRKFVGDALLCSHTDTATTVLPHQQVDDSGDALTMP